jgi:CheY-like chemotaxis protein
LPRKILLADDSVTAQNMGRKILHDAGYEVVTVNNGSAALKKVAEAKPELIVLDVYMPGYSGLEVCQRIKETRETAHIPVLLTVGKLEPFKQDEARRVRADAFIIKPFEATELLAALGKLEDRIVSSPSPSKETKPTGTMAEFERFVGERGARYGDQESGWKARLTIPSAGPKLTEAESEPEPALPTASTFRELVPEEKPRIAAVPSATTMERPIPAGIPQDITPDEIAALAAAAARLRGGVSVGKDFERLADKAPEAQTSVEKKEEAVVKVPSTEVEGAAKAATVESSSATVEPEIETRKEFEPKVEGPAAAKSAAPTGTAETEIQPVSQAVPSAAEVDVVLRSIASSKDKDAASTMTLASVPAQEPEPVTAAVAVSPAATMAVGARWVAEEVPVDAAEAVLVLESEMRKAHAAFAAAENAAPKTSEPAVIDKYEPAPVDKADEPRFATMAPPAIGAPVPVIETAQSAPETSAEESEPAPSFREVQREISKPPAPPFTPPAMSVEEESKHAAPALGGPHLGEPETTATSAVSTPPVSATSEGKPDNNEAGAAQRQAELASATAAAWASWKDIREAMTGTKPGSPAPQPATEAELEQLKSLKGLKPESQPAATPEAAMAAAASADGSTSNADANLASIVDSMLAELKPKLMAELAEKLKKEKK